MFWKLLITTALALPLAYGGGVATAQTTNKPNIVVIMGAMTVRFIFLIWILIKIWNTARKARNTAPRIKRSGIGGKWQILSY